MEPLTIDRDPPRTGLCDCCGGTTTRLTRWVRHEGGAFASYVAVFSDNHPERSVALAVILGSWGVGTSARDRVVFVMDLRGSADAPGAKVVDGSRSRFADAGGMGRVLEREEAMANPLLEDAFGVLDAAWALDVELDAYLNAAR